MIEYKVGDLLETTDPFIAHGCNSLGIMGAGLALQIARRYPWVAEKFKKAHEWEVQFNGAQHLEMGGVYEYAQRDAPYRILNLITQGAFGRNGKFVSYDAVDLAFKAVGARIGTSPISIPRIGAGLGGGDWRVIEAIIESLIHRDIIKARVTVWDLK
jgi:O-acetyl-ADP-ribose deacetylase (regulator of RNase III)